MSRVVFHQITKVYDGKVTAIQNFNLEIAEGEFMVLVGPSGCGKSTVLRMVAGLEAITSGEIFIGERKVNSIPPKDRDVAMVFQNYALYPHMSVYKNMAFGLQLRKFPKTEIDKRIRKAAEMLGISDLLDRKPKALSGGQRQRVAVGRAIVRNPQVFLFDEPLSNLDAQFRVQMRAELIQLHRRLQTTIIYVTHDQTEAMIMGDRITVLKDGLIQQVDSPLRVYNHPLNHFVAGFIGTPPMNFISGTIEKKTDHLRFNEVSFSLPCPADLIVPLQSWVGKSIFLGIRPEDIHEAETMDQSGLHHEITAQVEWIEPLGAESFWHLTTGRNRFIARVPAQAHAQNYAEKKLVFNLSKVHYFDPETGKSISHSTLG